MARAHRQFLFAAVLFSGPSLATDVDGNLSTSIWWVKNNISQQSNALASDDYGEDYLQSQYTLFSLGTKLRARSLLPSSSSSQLNFYFDGRGLINLQKDRYTLGISDRQRYDLHLLTFELRDAFGGTDLWLGRQTLLEAGGPRFDGPRVLARLNPNLDLGFYGGLGQNPRNATGYIGVGFEPDLFTIDFYAAGAYANYRAQPLSFDFAINTELFKTQLDRLYSFAQATYELSPELRVTGLSYLALVPLQWNQLQLGFWWRPVERFTHTLTFYRHEPLEYNKSDASLIPTLGLVSLDAAVGGPNNLNTQAYISLNNQSTYKLDGSNYVFAGLDFAHRNFDDRQRWRYFFGYRSPNFFHSSWDLRIQANIIDNFQSFNTSLETLVGREIGQGRARVEAGATFYAHERELFTNFTATGLRQIEKEQAYHVNAYYYAAKGTTLSLGYSLWREVEALNDSEKVLIHEVFFGSNLAF